MVKSGAEMFGVQPRLEDISALPFSPASGCNRRTASWYRMGVRITHHWHRFIKKHRRQAADCLSAFIAVHSACPESRGWEV